MEALLCLIRRLYRQNSGRKCGTQYGTDAENSGTRKKQKLANAKSPEAALLQPKPCMRTQGAQPNGESRGGWRRVV